MSGIFNRLCFLAFGILPFFAAGSDAPVRYLGIEHGLSNNAVTSIYQDYKGFMWFGTYDGLNRYDGYGFKIFRNRIGDSTSLIDNGIYTIEGDRQHHIWIGGRKGVCLFDPAKSGFSTPLFIKSDNHSESKITGNVHVIKADSAGNIFIGTEYSGLLLFENNKSRGQQIPLRTGSGLVINYEVMAIEWAAEGSYAWVFVQNEGLGIYDSRGKTLRILNGGIKKCNCLKIDRSGNLWLGNDNGLYRYDHTSDTFSNNYIPGSSRIINLCSDKAGVLWIGSDGDGILVMHSPGEPVIPLVSSEGKPVINSNAVFSIYEDQEGRKWIGTLRGGVNIIENRARPFKTIFFQPGNSNTPLVNNFILSFCEAADQRIWIGTDGGGLRRWDRGKNTYTGYVHDPANQGSISSNFITNILNDDENTLWISTWSGGINHYRSSTGTFEHYSCFNPYTHTEEKNVWLLFEDAEKTLWASTTNNGTLYSLNRPANRFDLFDNSIVNIQCLSEDREGNFWGGNYSSLIKIDKGGKKHMVYPIGYTVRSIHEDKRGNFWVGTDGGGLLLFNRATGSYQRFTDSDGLPSNSILRILEDGRGNLWISTFNGLCRFDPLKKNCRNFSQSDGLQSNQFSFNAALQLKSGEFLFGGIKGFNIFYPDSVYDRGGKPRVFITGMKVNNIPLEKNDSYVSKRTLEDIQELTIPYDRAALSIDFVALEYSSPDKINYAYYLDGWDKVWNYTAGSRTASYTRLAEGTYIFRIRATDEDGKWSDRAQAITIIVLPPWYRTWWAYLLYGLCVATGIYLYIRYTSRQERLKYEVKLAHLENEKEKELNEKKLSFFTDISHEFRTPLTLIINPIKELIHSKGSKTDTNDLIPIVHRNARRLLSLVDQLLLFRKADSEGDKLKVSRLNIAELCNEVYMCFTTHAKSKHILYQFLCDNKDLEIDADYEKIEIALFNLLSNAFKFTPDRGRIDFILTETGKGVCIEISDTGCGIQENDLNRIFDKFRQVHANSKGKAGFGIGLFLVKHFIERHKGTVTCKSIPGEGSIFTICLLKQIPELGEAYIMESPGRKFELLEELMEEDSGVPDEAPGILPDGKRAEEVVTDKKSILLIDDNAEILQYLHRLFSSKYLLYAASNGIDGFRLAEEHIPDLIISDINMAGMDGVELCTKIKQSAFMGHIPVILLTAATTSETRLKGIEGGADDYFTKPFDSEHLVARVEAVLKNRNMLQRYFLDSITLKESTVKVPKEYQDFLRKCITVIEENIDNEEFTMKKFSKAMGMSHSRLNQKVKTISGQRLNAFIRSIRLRRAAVLMLTENVNVSQAAFQVGISDTRYFREQFVGIFGITPSEYIKKYRQSFNQDLNIIREE